MRAAYIIALLAVAFCCLTISSVAAEGPMGVAEVVAAPAPNSRYLMQERYPQPGKGAPPIANASTAAAPEPAPAPAPKKSSAGAYSTGALPLLAAAAAAAVFVL